MGDPYWISFTDLLTALLFVIILAALAFMAQVGEKQQALATLESQLTSRIDSLEAQREAIDTQVVELSKAEEIRTEILDEAKTELAKLGIKVELNDDQTVLSIPTEELGFASGQYEIAPAHQARAVDIGKVLHKILTRDGRAKYLDTIFIEGHTDGRPFNGLNGTGNWGLSTFRAISLWQLWLDRIPAKDSLDAMRNSAGHKLVSVSGYADTRPVRGSAGDATDVPENRRIDIRITVIRPSSADLDAILDVGNDGGNG